MRGCSEMFEVSGVDGVGGGEGVGQYGGGRGGASGS